MTATGRSSSSNRVSTACAGNASPSVSSRRCGWPNKLLSRRLISEPATPSCRAGTGVLDALVEHRQRDLGGGHALVDRDDLLPVIDSLLRGHVRSVLGGP